MTIDEMVAALERELRVTEPDPVGSHDPLNDWPVHKLAAWVYNDAGPDWLTALLKHADLRYEDLVDNAAELERRHFPHIAEVLLKAAENARSHVDDIIEREPPEWVKPYGPTAVHKRRRWFLGQWLRDRAKITGQSQNELIGFYGLEDWLGNGAERVH
jgi:hypothetical protein